MSEREDVAVGINRKKQTRIKPKSSKYKTTTLYCHNNFNFFFFIIFFVLFLKGLKDVAKDKNHKTFEEMRAESLK